MVAKYIFVLRAMQRVIRTGENNLPFNYIFLPLNFAEMKNKIQHKNITKLIYNR